MQYPQLSETTGFFSSVTTFSYRVSRGKRYKALSGSQKTLHYSGTVPKATEMRSRGRGADNWRTSHQGGRNVIDSPSTRGELPSFDSCDGEYIAAPRIKTETIDLNAMIEELKSPTFLSSRYVPETTLGKLLHSVPVPTLLIDESCSIIFLNQSWERISPAYPKVLGRTFSSLFPNRSVAQEADALVRKVIAARKGILPGAVLEIEKKAIWGRVHLRALRMGGGAAILALVEDLSAERKQLLLIEKHKREREAQEH